MEAGKSIPKDFLYLCLREFRTAQRRFKRNVRETLKVADLSSGYDAITEREFSNAVKPLVPTWSDHEISDDICPG